MSVDAAAAASCLKSAGLEERAVRARRVTAEARSLAATARQAYAQNNLDQRTLTDYETTALERALQVVTIERQINEGKIFLAVELGLGLPKARIALSGRALL